MTLHADIWYVHIMVVLKPSAANVYVFKIIYASRKRVPNYLSL